ncbi:outer membrane beta-barrel protein [Methylobacterium sp. J-068]|uniref:outer membrane beta-barrel protein n=1 Tax=Methylobacterium sp. J-068 TaxID=2836649 RepID=UPI001FBB1E38|nr:outer membrane beta-barrel protein [Methylobacterium sp. J-068]MCJ2035302.1 outer membrane beta-barrel protein [Methylobacterium sp. J-068]
MTRAAPNAGRSNRSLAGLAVTAVLVLGPGTVSAQVQGTDPGSGTSSGSGTTSGSGDPRTESGAGTGLSSGNGLRGSALSGGASSPSLSSSTAGSSTTGETSGGAASTTRPLAGSRSGSALTFSGTSGANNRAPTNLLRLRAAPPRRFGSATVKPIRAVTQTNSYDLRLTPVVRNPVIGVPLPTLLPLAGVQTPGFFLGTALRRPLTVDEAYAPLGIKVGTFTILPALQQSVGYDTNPDQITNRLAKPSLALRTDGEVTFRSDWSSSELTGDLRGGYIDYPDNDGASRPNGSGVTRLRIDANRDTRIDVEGRFVLDTQRAGTPDLAAAVATRPLVTSYGTTVGVTERFNRVQVSVRGLFDRSEFEDAQLSNGTILRQSDRNLNQYGLQLRAGYEISPVITPFVDVLADTRVYDLRVDSTGIRRNSDGLTLSGGASFALTRFVTGEISGGLQHRTYADPTLRDVTAPILSASLIWTASPLTTVRLNAATGVTETTVAGSGGVLTQTATLEVQHDLLRNLSLIGGISYLSNDYDRVNITERGFSATARLDYRFNRWLALRGSYIYQRIDSSVAGSSFSANTFLLGMRINP